jgi:regulator of protease activity HflC (stomatin/prohibitin superfamily)
MNRTNRSSMVVILMCVVLGCLSGCTTIEPGWTGIKVNKTGDNKGVSKDNLVTGWVFYFPLTTKIIEYPTFNQRVAWTVNPHEGKATNEELSFQTSDNIPVTMDVAVNYTLQASKVPEFYMQFRADNIDFFTHGYMRDQARNAVSNIGSEYTFDEINGVKKEEFLSKVNIYLAKSVEAYGVVVNKNGFSLIGALRPPESLKAAISQRAQAIQQSIQAENELRTAKANAAKSVAAAEGIAASNKALASSLTPVLMEWERLQIEKVKANKWNGVMPTTMLGSTTPLITLK